MAKLTKKQEAFVDEYLIDLNATQAAIRAGYSPRTANEQSSRMLVNVNIQNRLKERMQQKESERIASADEVLRRLTEIARGEAKEEIVGFSSEGDVLRTEKEPYIKDRIKALELLGKRHMLFDKGQVDITIKDDGFIDALKNAGRNIWGDEPAGGDDGGEDQE